jgi:hypothetical protein
MILACQGQEDHIRGGCSRVEGQACVFAQSLGQLPGPQMVLAQARDHFFERHDSRGSQDAGLAHTAPEHLARPMRLADKLAGSAQDRTDRRGKSLAQTKRDRVDRGSELPGRNSKGNRGIENAGAVQMNFQPAQMGEFCQPAGVFRRLDRAAAAIVAVLETDEARHRIVRIVRPDGGFDLRQQERSVGLVIELAGMNAAQRGDPSGFEQKSMVLPPEDGLIPAAAMGQDRSQVAHGP